MEFTITAHNGDSVKSEAENWMVAIGKAFAFFEVEIEDVQRLTCSVSADGSVFVDGGDPTRSWMIRRVEQKIQVVAAARSARMEDIEPPRQKEKPKEVLPKTPPPQLTMPARSTLRKEVEDINALAERLFDLSMDIAVAEPDEACRMALDVIESFVPAEAMSIARGTLNDPCLTFVAASGPVSDRIIGRTIQFGEGIIGMAFDMGGTVQVRDAADHERHLHHMDSETGFSTQVALCVPITDDEGNSYGVIELLNPEGDQFSSQHVEAVETISRTLAGALREQLG